MREVKFLALVHVLPNNSKLPTNSSIHLAIPQLMAQSQTAPTHINAGMWPHPERGTLRFTRQSYKNQSVPSRPPRQCSRRFRPSEDIHNFVFHVSRLLGPVLYPFQRSVVTLFVAQFVANFFSFNATLKIDYILCTQFGCPYTIPNNFGVNLIAGYLERPLYPRHDVNLFCI